METEESDMCGEAAPALDCSSSAQKDQNSDDTANTDKDESNNENKDEDLEQQQVKDSGEASDQVTRQKSKSPEPSCSICLGKVENKSFTDSCFHTFCFVCLVEWSKVKPVCPLCKQPFKSIIHNVRSNEDYDQYHLELRDRSSESQRTSRNNDERFRYRTTLTRQNWIDRQFELQRRQLELLQRPSVTTTRSMWSRHRQASTSAFRKRIYTSGMRVSEVRTACGRPLRQREVSPAFFTRNPACIHRLVPWLNRELNVLLHNHEDNVQFVLELIMDLLKRFDIQGEEFAEHLRSFLGQRTEHFIHEFYSFCRSPYDMVAYDGYAVYGISNTSEEPHEISSPSSSDDSVISVNIIASPGSTTNAIHDGGVIVLNSDDEEVVPSTSSTSIPQPSTSHDIYSSNLLNSVRHFLSSASNRSPPWGWESPSLGADWRIPSTSHTVLPVTVDSVLDLSVPSSSQQHLPDDDESYPAAMGSSTQTTGGGEGPTTLVLDQEDDSDINVEGTVDAGSPVFHRVKIKCESVSSFGSEIEIVGYEKPWDDRSPVAVSSPGEEEMQMIEQLEKKKKLKEAKAKAANRVRSSSSSSSDSRRPRKKKKKTKTRSRSRHRSRSESTSYFREYDRKRRSHAKSKRSRSRHRGDRSRSRHRRSRSRKRYQRSRSDSSRRSRHRRRRSRSRSHGRDRRRSHSRSQARSRRNSRSRSKTRKSRSRSRTRKSRSRSRTRKSKKRSRSRTRRGHRRSRSVSVEYCALGKYDVPSKRRERDSDKSRKQNSSSYTQEWVHGKKSSDTGVHRRSRRSRSGSSSSSIVCLARKSGNEKRRRRQTSDSIEVVYESEKRSLKSSKSKASKGDKESRRRRSRSVVTVDSRKRRSREKSKHRDTTDRRDKERGGCKKHTTGHKGSSKK